MLCIAEEPVREFGAELPILGRAGAQLEPPKAEEEEAEGCARCASWRESAMAILMSSSSSGCEELLVSGTRGLLDENAAIARLTSSSSSGWDQTGAPAVELDEEEEEVEAVEAIARLTPSSSSGRDQSGADVRGMEELDDDGMAAFTPASSSGLDQLGVSEPWGLDDQGKLKADGATAPFLSSSAGAIQLFVAEGTSVFRAMTEEALASPVGSAPAGRRHGVRSSSGILRLFIAIMTRR